MLRELVPLSCLLENNSKWILEMDLPGVDRKNIEVNMTRGHVVVKARLKEAYTVSNHGHVIKFETMKKVVSLPPHADLKKVSARFRDGILTITIPRTDAGKKIPVG